MPFYSNNICFKLQGGMSNELYNTIARVTDGIFEGYPNIKKTIMHSISWNAFHFRTGY